MQKFNHSTPPWYVQECQDVYNERHFQVWGHDGELVCIGHNMDDGNVISAALDLYLALVSIGGMPDGYCFCPENRNPKKPGPNHTGECTMAKDAILKAGRVVVE